MSEHEVKIAPADERADAPAVVIPEQIEDIIGQHVTPSKREKLREHLRALLRVDAVLGAKVSQLAAALERVRSARHIPEDVRDIATAALEQLEAQ